MTGKYKKTSAILLALAYIVIFYRIYSSHFLPISKGKELFNNGSILESSIFSNKAEYKTLCILPYYTTAKELHLNHEFKSFIHKRVNILYGNSEQYWWIFSEDHNGKYDAFKIFGEKIIPAYKSALCYEMKSHQPLVENNLLLFKAL